MCALVAHAPVLSVIPLTWTAQRLRQGAEEAGRLMVKHWVAGGQGVHEVEGGLAETKLGLDQAQEHAVRGGEAVPEGGVGKQ
jgi:hypothetical protein